MKCKKGRKKNRLATKEFFFIQLSLNHCRTDYRMLLNTRWRSKTICHNALSVIVAFDYCLSTSWAGRQTDIPHKRRPTVAGFQLQLSRWSIVKGTILSKNTMHFRFGNRNETLPIVNATH